MTEDQRAPADRGNIVPANRRALALTTSLLVQFTSVMTSTSVTTAAPSIVAALGGFGQYAWIFSSYTLTSSIATATAGKLSDVAGRRVFYLGGLVVFIAGNLGAGLATSLGMLIACRAVAGLGGGALAAVSQATIGDVFPPRQRARWYAVTMVTFGLGLSLGPFGGGYVVALFGWRWVFLGVVVPAVVAVALVAVSIPTFVRRGRIVVDWPGVALLGVGLLGVMFALADESGLGAWQAAARVAAAVAALACIVLFIAHERRTASPILPPWLFRIRIFRRAIGTNLLFSLIFNSTITFVPLYVVGVLAAGPEVAGRIVVPFMVAHVVAGVGTGQVFSRLGGYRVLAIAAAALAFAATAILAAGAVREVSGWLLIVAMVSGGLGTGIGLPLMAIIIQGAFPHRILGMANSSRLFFLNLGTVLSVPTLTAIIMVPLAAAGASGALVGSGAVTPALRGTLALGLSLAFGVVTLFGAAALVVGLRVPRFQLSDEFLEELPGEPATLPAVGGADVRVP